MKYFKLYENNNCITYDRNSITVELIKNLSTDNILYVLSGGKYVGCIGNTEKQKSIINQKVVINTNSIFLKNNEDLETQATQIFQSKKNIHSIPVVDDDNYFLYELKHSYELFYEQLKEKDIKERSEISVSDKIVVSLTSYGERIRTVDIAIKSIMYQSLRPSEVVLYIAEEDKNKKIHNEEELKALGLIIKRGTENLGPHKKYYYAFNEYKDSLIVTIDDDLIYDDNLIEMLYMKHKEYRNDIISIRGHRIKYDSDKIEKYLDWEYETNGLRPEYELCHTGGAGTLYPVGDYRNQYLQKEVFMKCSPSADDIWMKIVELINRKKTYVIGNIGLTYVYDTQTNTLAKSNCFDGINDISIEKLEHFFNINVAELLSNLAE